MNISRFAWIGLLVVAALACQSGEITGKGSSKNDRDAQVPDGTGGKGSGGTSGGAKASRAALETVGKDGGEVGLPDGPTLLVPPGALSKDVNILMTESQDPPVALVPFGEPNTELGGAVLLALPGPTEAPQGGPAIEGLLPPGDAGSGPKDPPMEMVTVASPAVTLEPHGLMFDAPVTVTIPIDANKIPDEAMQALTDAAAQMTETAPSETPSLDPSGSWPDSKDENDFEPPASPASEATPPPDDQSPPHFKTDAKDLTPKRVPLWFFRVLRLKDGSDTDWQEQKIIVYLTDKGELQFEIEHFSIYLVVFRDHPHSCADCGGDPETFQATLLDCIGHEMQTAHDNDDKSDYGKQLQLATSHCVDLLPCQGYLWAGPKIGWVIRQDDQCHCGYNQFFSSTCSGRGTCVAATNGTPNPHFEASCDCYDFNWKDGKGHFSGKHCEDADYCPDDAKKTEPGACGCGVADDDGDKDGTADCNDQCPNDTNKQAPGMCGCGKDDTDSDSDGTANCDDTCPNDANKTKPGTCGCGMPDKDTDKDGQLDCQEQCPKDPQKTQPGVCGCGVADVDTDNDQTLDCNDLCPNDASKQTPGVCGCNNPDVDSDADGTADCNDQCPTDSTKLLPLVCGCNVPETDSDNDATPDCNDACPNDLLKISAGVCGCNVPDVDSDSDGAFDCVDNCPSDSQKTQPGGCGCGVADVDTDGDTTFDCVDGCPSDNQKIAAGTCGCGVSDNDADSDGTPDCNDQCPSDANKQLPGTCGCGVSDNDADSDGTPDCNDGCPHDAAKLAPGACSCGFADTDTDNDGTADCNDTCPSDANKLNPGQCGCGVSDNDADSDGTPDCNDGCPNDVNKLSAGLCGCGTPETDSDGDAVPDCTDLCPSDPAKQTAGTCGCGNADVDGDGDGTADCADACPTDPAKITQGVCGCGVADVDTDGDGSFDCNDGCINDPAKTAPLTCGCGTPDVDTDNDGSLDCNDTCPSDANKTAPGQCGCGVSDIDSDGDSTPDCHDACPSDKNKLAPGACGCGISDNDADADGTPDCSDGCANDPTKQAPGSCGCGTPDLDSDSDGTFDCTDGCINDPAKQAPGVCGCGIADVDIDGDGSMDCVDNCPSDPNKSAPGICGCGTPDLDSDGVLDCNDQCPNDAAKNVPGTCGCGISDNDADGDGTVDCNDGCPSDPNKVAAGVCGCNIADSDSDGDGTKDCNDQCPSDPNKTLPSLCGCGTADTDSDSDGTPDCNDNCPSDPNKVIPKVCGCGNPETDSDGDSIKDCIDGCPNDAFKQAPGVCGCGVADTDTDLDGTLDCNDGCPSDGAKTNPGACGCGNIDLDADSDGFYVCQEVCDHDPNKQDPGVCGCGNPETDNDGDGTPNCADGCPNDIGKLAPGVCGCGVSDTDVDSDGVLDCNDNCPVDYNPGQQNVYGGAAAGDACDDVDGDGTTDLNDGCPTDTNKQAAGQCGCGNLDTDSDGDASADCVDGCPSDGGKVAPGVCGCGIADYDSDGDGVLDCNDNCPVDYNPGQENVYGGAAAGDACDDVDGDGTTDLNDGCPTDTNKQAAGQCGCGNSDFDQDGDGTADCLDNCPSDGAKTDPGICGCGSADVDNDADGYLQCQDCDDFDFNSHPGGSESCDGMDNDCDGTADNVDRDGDGYNACIDDCDDNDVNIHPGATEVCDGIDNDCSGQTDSGDDNLQPCDDGNACTVDTCGSGACSFAALPDDTDCDDGNACNGVGVCLAGTCMNGPLPQSCVGSATAMSFFNTTNGGSYLSMFADGNVLSSGDSGSGALLDSGLGTINASYPTPERRMSIWSATGNASGQAVGGFQNKQGYWEDGTQAWNWAQLGCCNYGVGPSVAIDDAGGYGYTAANYTLFYMDMHNGSGGSITGMAPQGGWVSLAANNVFYVASNGSTEVARLDMETGQEWSVPLAAPLAPVRPGAIAADGSYVVTTGGMHGMSITPGVLARLRTDGSVAYNLPIDAVTAPVIGPNNRVYVGVHHDPNAPWTAGHVEAHDLMTGVLLWSAVTPGMPNDLLVGDDGQVYVVSGYDFDGTLSTYSQATGAPLQVITHVPTAWELMLKDGTLYAGTSNGVTAFPTSAFNYPLDAPWPVLEHDNQRTNAASKTLGDGNTSLRMFVSSGWRPGGGLAAANAQCQADANAAGLGGKFDAYLATSGGSANAQFSKVAGRFIQRIDYSVVASGIDTLAEVDLQNAVLLDAFGNTASALAWTGVNNQHCNDWTDASANNVATVGLTNVQSTLWQWFTNTSCDQTASLYCLENLAPPRAYYQNVVITPAAGNGTPADYQTVIDIGPGNPLWNHLYSSTGDDIRVVDTNANALSLWIEQLDVLNQHARIWVKLPFAISPGNSVTLQLQYGDSGNSNVSDIGATMDFGDDFRVDNTIQSTLWQAGDGSAPPNATAFSQVAPVGGMPGMLKTNNSGDLVTGRLRSLASFNGPLVLQAASTTQSDSQDGIMVAGFDSEIPSAANNGVGVLGGQASGDMVRYGNTWDTGIGYHQIGVTSRYTLANDGAGGGDNNKLARDNMVNGAWTNQWTRPTAGADVFPIAPMMFPQSSNVTTSPSCPNSTSSTCIGYADLISAPSLTIACGAQTLNVTTLLQPANTVTLCGQNVPALVRTQVGGGTVLVIPLQSLSINNGSSLRFTGDKPVIFIVDGNVAINGILDVGSQTTASQGAGPGACIAAGGLGHSGTATTTGGGGGGGGGFGTNGASGGKGNCGTGCVSGGVASAPEGAANLIPLRGGCVGGVGGNGGGGAAGGAGGLGGGAVQISALGQILVSSSGLINANGGGGKGGGKATTIGQGGAGGGGGGSGGAALLEAPTVTLLGQVLTNGGGGGGGGGGNNGAATVGNDGANGGAGSPAAGGTAGAGPNPGAVGGAGGVGPNGPIAAGGGANAGNLGGAGAGGGGAGRFVSGTIGTTSAGMRITLGNRYDSGTSPTFSNQSVNVSWDWVLVRKFLANEPGVTVSNVEVAIP